MKFGKIILRLTIAYCIVYWTVRLFIYLIQSSINIWQ